MRRRTLIQVGAVGAVGLAAVALFSSRPNTPPAGSGGGSASLDPAAMELFTALAPVVIGPACATAGDAQRAAEGVAIALTQLSPAAQDEVRQLLQILALAPARAVMAGIWAPWSEATPQDLHAFLERWRHSRLSLLQTAYHALHDLILGAWYADPASWPAIGYAGPPTLKAAA